MKFVQVATFKVSGSTYVTTVEEKEEETTT